MTRVEGVAFAVPIEVSGVYDRRCETSQWVARAPRGGTWGDLVATALREQGANTVIAPLVDFAHTSEEEKLVEALKRLEAGYYDWITATSATVVDVLAYHNAVIPPKTRVAAVGEATIQAFTDAGYQVSRTPTEENHTTEGLLKVGPEIDSCEVLGAPTLRSDVAKPVLTSGLIDRGHDVTQVVAFRTIGVPVQVYLAWIFERVGTHRVLFDLDLAELTPAAFKSTLG